LDNFRVPTIADQHWYFSLSGILAGIRFFEWNPILTPNQVVLGSPGGIVHLRLFPGA
jgi:hypothetical protein